MSKVLRCFNCDDVILGLSPAEISDKRWEIIEEFPSLARPCERMIRDGQFICQSCLDYESKLYEHIRQRWLAGVLCTM